jgi:hypothetical protein
MVVDRFPCRTDPLSSALYRGTVWYPLHVGALQIRLGIFLLLAKIATAQQILPGTSTDSSIPEPKLPVIDYDACPGKGRIVPNWKIRRHSPLYSSWQDDRTQTGTLKPGEKVTVLKGVNVIGKPDRIMVTRPFPDIYLKPGDIILRYGHLGEGVANIWAKGVWHKEYDLWRTTGKDGRTGCLAQDECNSKVIEEGIQEHWVQVKTSGGHTGWVSSLKVTRGAFWSSGNFDRLCAS